MSSTKPIDAGAAPLVCIMLDGATLEVAGGISLAAALLAAGVSSLRKSPQAGTPRGAFCFMGTCQECVVLVDGALAQACQVGTRAGMRVVRGGATA